MNEKQKKEPKEPLRIPLDFEETLSDLLKVKPERVPEAEKQVKKKAAKAIKK
jgi:hypothetical protein